MDVYVFKFGIYAMSGDDSTSSNDITKQSEYEAYKNVCNSPPPPTGDHCKDLSNRIKWMKQCRDLRQQWDDKYSPGRHDEPIRQLTQKIKKLEKRYKNSWECRDEPLECN